MMSGIAIRVENLSKMYRIGRARERHDTLRDALVAGLRARLERPQGERNTLAKIENTIWALKEVSFEVRRGEVLGIIGRNGAGKSTLLKILSRITEPTEGKAEIRGRVGSLLEVGTGFHPELTGRENVYLNGAILGMRRSEIEAKFQEIVAFAEIERFLDTPVKRYSSGMYVRLAFAVAAHLEPEVVLVDEVLAVGDTAFQTKCLGRMGDVAREGRTVLLVSHNMTSILNLCSRAMLLDAGHIVYDGDASTAVERYLAHHGQRNEFLPEGAAEAGDYRARIESFEVRPIQPRTGSPTEFHFTISRDETSTSELWLELAVSVLSSRGDRLLQVYSRHMGRRLAIQPGMTRVTARLDCLPLAPGDYRLNLWLGAGDTPVHWLRDCYVLSVRPGSFSPPSYVDNRGYPVVVPSSWGVSWASALRERQATVAVQTSHRESGRARADSTSQ